MRYTYTIFTHVRFNLQLSSLRDAFWLCYLFCFYFEIYIFFKLKNSDSHSFFSQYIQRNEMQPETSPTYKIL